MEVIIKNSIEILKSLWLLVAAFIIMTGHTWPTWLLFIIVIITISAPLIREFRKRTDLDERQIQISHFTSHIAYFVFSTLLVLLFIKEKTTDGSFYFYWYILLFAPMLLKIIICAVQSYGPIESGFRGIFYLFFRGVVNTKLLDERQHDIGNFSSHFAFYLYLTLSLFFIVFNFDHLGKYPSTVWHMLLFVPLFVKFYVSLFKSYGLGQGARFVGYAISGFWLLYVLLSHGFSLDSLKEAAPFLLLFLFTILSKRYPLIGGIIFLVLGIASIYFFNSIWIKKGLYMVIWMYSLIPLPVLLSAISFFIEFGSKKKKERDDYEQYKQ